MIDNRGTRFGRLRALLVAGHIGPGAVVTVVTVGLGVGVGIAADRLLVLGVAVLAGQLSVGWSNDWIDAGFGRDGGRQDKPISEGAVTVDVVRRAALVALAICGATSAALGAVPATLHLGAVGLAWAYNWRLKATRLSVVSYIVAFAVLPIVVTTTAQEGLPAGWAVLAAACFGAGVHLSNVLPDLDRDRAAGVMGLPQRMGRPAALLGSVTLLAIGAAAALVGPFPIDAVPVAAMAVLVAALGLLAAAVHAGRSGRLERAYQFTVVVGLLVVGGLVASGGRLTGG